MPIINYLTDSKRAKQSIAFITALYLLNLSSALAATAPLTVETIPNIPNIADPARVSNELTLAEPSKRKVQHAIKVPYSKAQIPTEQAEKYKFKLTRVIIAGDTVIPEHKLLEHFKPYLNKEISLATLQTLTNKITNQYRNAGYILSKATLPPQVIDKGVVRIQIIEGYISKVVIKGHPGGAKKLLEKYGDKITRSHPLRMQVLERYLLLANDIPGTTVQGVLQASKDTPGSAELILLAKQQRVEGGLAYDNYSTPYLGPQEVTLYTNINSVIQSGDKTSLNIISNTNTRQLRYLQLTHSAPLGADGAQWQLGTNYTKTQPGTILDPLDIEGTSKSVFGNISYPFIRSREQNLTVQGGFKYLDSDTTLLGEPYYDDRIRSLLLGSTYQVADAWHGTNLINVEGEQGFSVLGANNNGDHSRPDGRTDFTKFTTQVTRLQALGGRFSLLGSVQGQYSFVPLLAAEQFGFGGANLGRGYDLSEITGDRGIAGKVELIMTTNPGYRVLKQVQYYTFYDAGEIWNIDNTSQPGKASATSTGLGTRLYFTSNLSGNLFIAKPLTRKVASAVALGNNGRAPRVFFQLSFNI